MNIIDLYKIYIYEQYKHINVINNHTIWKIFDGILVLN